MSDADLIADYDAMIAALKARAAERGVSYGQLDQLAGTPDGYAGKVFGPSQTKKLGFQSFWYYLQALGLGLAFVENPEALAARQHLHGGRNACQARAGGHTGPVGRHAIRRVLRHLASAGGRASFAKKSATERRHHQQRAANALWKKARAGGIVGVLLLSVLGISDVRAQGAPRDINIVVGTTPTLVVPPDNGPRGAISFINPSITSTVAVCPTADRGGKPFTCAINGAGSITLYPLDSFSITFPDIREYASGAWNAVASAPNSPLTILDHSP
jgi:hypothetical protein